MGPWPAVRTRVPYFVLCPIATAVAGHRTGCQDREPCAARRKSLPTLGLRAAHLPSTTRAVLGPPLPEQTMQFERRPDRRCTTECSADKQPCAMTVHMPVCSCNEDSGHCDGMKNARSTCDPLNDSATVLHEDTVC
jgi:hypothetical protein